MATADIIANMVTEAGGARPYQVRPTPVESLNTLAHLFIAALTAVEREVEQWHDDGQLVYVCDILNTVGVAGCFPYQTTLDAWALWKHAAALTGMDKTGLGWWPQTERGMACRIAAIKEAVRLASQGWTP